MALTFYVLVNLDWIVIDFDGCFCCYFDIWWSNDKMMASKSIWKTVNKWFRWLHFHRTNEIQFAEIWNETPRAHEFTTSSTNAFVLATESVYLENWFQSRQRVCVCQAINDNIEEKPIYVQQQQLLEC